MSPAKYLLGVLSLSLAVFTVESLTAAPNQNQGIKKAQNQALATAHAQILQELRATRQLLVNADHDYQGHRAKAVHEVTHAIHLLEHHKRHPNPASAVGNLKGGPRGNREAQKVSDAQLGQAIQQLQVIAGQIQTLPVSQNHHQQALQAISHAIQQLQTALKVA